MDDKIEELYSAVSALHCVRKPKLLCSIIHYMPRFCKSLLQNLQLQIKSKSLLNVMSGNYLDLLLCDIEAWSRIRGMAKSVLCSTPVQGESILDVTAVSAGMFFPCLHDDYRNSQRWKPWELGSVSPTQVSTQTEQDGEYQHYQIFLGQCWNIFRECVE